MPPKEDNSAAAKADHTQDENITVTVNVDDFSRTRDRVVYTLAALQSAVADLQRAFVTHADTVLNMGGVRASTNASLIGVPSLNGILDAGAAAGIAAQTSGTAGGVAAQKDGVGAAAGAGATSDSEDVEKGKKKKRKHDPNAPKRPLTPYFLYMQQNRLKIAEEMPADKRPQDVSNEGTRRWQAMPEEERSIYAKQYLQNLEVYRAKMEAYKAGRPVPDDATIAADLQLQKDVERDVESTTASSAADAAKGGAKGRGKGDKATTSETGTENSSSSSSEEEPSSSSSSESEAQKSATKRRRRTAKEIAADKEKEKKKGSVTRSGAKKEEQLAARSNDTTDTPTKTPKSAEKAPKKRKRKSEVAAE